MMDSARSSPAGSGALRRAKSDAAEAGAGLRLHSVRTLALAFLCGALYAMCMTALSGGGLAAWREGLRGSPPFNRRGLMVSEREAATRLQQQQQQQQQADGSGTPAAAVPPRGLVSNATHLRLPWQPLLTRDELLRGMAFYGTGRRLQRMAHKLLSGQPVKIATLGGSITKGSGASGPEASYPARFFEALNASFPHRDHVFLNKGVGATSSGIFAACIKQMVPADVDLVVLEFTLNEHPDEPFTDPQRQGYEQLVRKLLQLPGSPAVVQLHSYAWWRAEGDGLDEGLFYAPTAESQLTVFSQYYDVPSLSVRSAVYPLMRAGVAGFRPDKIWLLGGKGNKLSASGEPIPRAEPEERPLFFYADRTHPNDLGHRAVAELLAAAVARAVEEAQGGGSLLPAWLPGRQEPLLAGMPPPMVPGNADAPTTLCAIQEDFKAVVAEATGFVYAPERPKEDTFVGQKWGWTAKKAGSVAELLFDSRADASSHDASPEDKARATVYLSHLKGYKRMGTAWVECVSGCDCERSVLDGTWAQQATLMQIHSFKVTQHARCRVRVTVRKEPGEVPQQGHKVTLMALMVSHYPLRMDQNMRQATEVARQVVDA